MRALYGVLVGFLRLVTSIFFRRIEVVGREHVPVTGPVIFVGNHPNSLLDPVLITTTCGRRVHFAAKDTLFESRLLRPILTTLGAVPIRRRQDHAPPQGPAAGAGGEAPLDNSAAFAALFDVLRGGAAFGIFPEGISHAGSELAPLKTGAARIALGFGAEHPEASVQVVPCGLSYHRRTRMRGRVLVQFGAPLAIDAARLEAWRGDERQAARALTEDLESALRALTINAPDWETLRVLDAVRRIYVPPDRELPLAQRAELSRRFLSRYEEVRADPEIQAVYAETARYVEELEALDLSDAQLRERPNAFKIAARLARHASLLFLGAPLSVPGMIVHAPVFALAVAAGDGLTRRRDVRATTKLMTTTLLIPLAYALVVALVAWLAPPELRWQLALGTAAFLPVSGWATLRVFERQAQLRRGLWVFASLFVLRRELRRLLAWRAELHAEIWRLVDRHADPDLPRIVPSE